jgi:hypothetical protein
MVAIIVAGKMALWQMSFLLPKQRVRTPLC